MSLADLVRECGNRRDIQQAKQIHEYIVRGNKGSKYLCNLLVQMYGKCGCLEEAKLVFDSMTCPNVFTFTVLMAAYVQNAHADEALQIFQKMLLEGHRPDVVALITAINACSSAKAALQQGRKIHSCCLEEQLYVHNALISMYGKCSSIDEAKQVFESMKHKDLVSWNSMISAFAHNGHFRDALELFEQLENSTLLKPDRITLISILDACAEAGDFSRGRQIHMKLGNCTNLDLRLSTTIMNMYGRAGELKDAEAVFHSMPQRDVFAWNTLINIYVQHGLSMQVLKLFKLMDLSGVTANNLTLLSVFEGCSSLEGKDSLTQAKHVHLAALGCGLVLELVTKNALLTMYWKCGGLEEAVKIFREECAIRSVVTWTTMISAYVHHGYPDKAVFLFRKMQQDGVEIDEVAYASILDAYAGLGWLEQGRKLHQRIVQLGLDSSLLVANALLNMYGKCDSILEARNMFDGMAVKNRNVITWNMMLAAYSQNRRFKEAMELYNEMLNFCEADKVTVVTVLYACAEAADAWTGKQVHVRMTNEIETDPSVKIALVHMYGKCGNVEEARRIFDQIPAEQQSIVAWTCLVTALAQNGYVDESLELVRGMDLEGVTPNEVTFVAVLYCCSHAGKLKDGREYFLSMRRDYGIFPTFAHYGCMVDLLGRSGKLSEAEELMSNVSCDVVDWTSLLSASVTHSDSQRAQHCADKISSRVFYTFRR